jgi:uncharacterized membrane protein
MKNFNISIKTITAAGIIGAAYAALTLLVYPLSYGPVQFRLSEALTVLPFFLPEAIPGLFIGCIAANLLSPNIAVLDVVFGSLATLAAAFATYKFGKMKTGIFYAPLPPVIINAITVGAIIALSAAPGEGGFGAFLSFVLSVGAGELVVCYGLGLPLLIALRKVFFGTNKREII